MLICGKPKIFHVDLYAVAAIIGVCVLTWYFLIKPLDDKIALQQEEQQKHRQNNESAQKELDDLQKLTRREQLLVARLQHTQNLLQDHVGIAEVISNMERLCNLCLIRLDEINPGPEYYAEHFQKSGLNLHLYGTFPQARQLLSKIEEELPCVRVKSISLVMKDTSWRLCELVIDLDIFSARQDADGEK